MGQGQVNRGQDVVGLKNALAWTGHYPVEKAHLGNPTTDEDLNWGLRGFQRDFGLKTDGFSRPGGETEVRLNDLISPLIQKVSANAAEPRSAAPTFDAPEAKVAAANSPDPSNTPSPVQLAQAQTAPSGNAGAPGTSPSTLPRIPTYKGPSGTPSTRVTQSDWIGFHSALDAQGITDPLEREIYGSIYSAEGGGKRDGTTVAGITADTLNKFQERVKLDPKLKWVGPRLQAAGIKPGMTPDQLSSEQQVAYYKIYIDSAVGPSKASDGKISGAEVFKTTIGDKSTVIAVADTVFREGGPNGTKLIQEAINKTYAEQGRQKSVVEDSILGSESLKAMGDLAKDPATRKQFIDNLMDGRSAFRATDPNINGENARLDSYRLP